MSALRLAVLSSIVAVTVPATVPGGAAAASPANDDRANAAPLTLPAAVTGTTTDATMEPPLEAQPGCGQIAGSVWYAFTAPRAGRLVVRVAMEGDQDATVEVIRRVRSQLTTLDCRRTAEDGTAAFSAGEVAENGTYLIRVGRRTGSVAGDFRLTARLADPPPAFPGRALPPAGARGTLDPLADPLDAFTVRLRAGVSYLVTSGIRGQGCAFVRVFPLEGRSFDDYALSVGGCNWVFFTPDASGRFPVLLRAGRNGTATQAYRLRVRAVGRDDVAPGLALPNLRAVRGSVNADGDPIDLYRFDVANRSQLDVGLATGRGQDARALLLTPGGGRITSFGTKDTAPIVVRRGRYFLAVISDDRATYRLQRVLRTITTTRLSLHRRIPLGSVASLGVRVSPRNDGPVTFVVERFEPYFGWQFDRKVSLRARNGRAVVRFRPGRSGLWRVSADYLGTRTAAPSSAGFRTFTVTEPLTP